ncbi:hypothetical protein J0H58_04455 [bacterium]|nr:hypothetical protein [bacterium]
MGCDAVETACDLADLEARPDGPYAMTTVHGGEPLSEAVWFLLHCASPDDAYFDGCRAAVGVSIGSPTWAAELRAAFADPGGFSSRVLAAEQRQAEPGGPADPRRGS